MLLECLREKRVQFLQGLVSNLDLAARMGVDIIAIRRNKDWILDPDETAHVFLGDILITRGAPMGIKEFKDIAEGKLAKLED